MVRANPHAAAGAYLPSILGYQLHLERRRFFPAFCLIQTSRGKDFERSAKVQHFDVVENDDADGLSIHGIASVQRSPAPMTAPDLC